MAKNQAYEYVFDVAYWNSKGNLTTKNNVKVRATNLAYASKAVERRFRAAYDIVCNYTDNPQGLPWEKEF